MNTYIHTHIPIQIDPEIPIYINTYILMHIPL